MPETLEDFLMTRPPTAERPLLGQTILAVEDSRFASDALRLICQRSGARLRRADCLAAAARHLRSYRPTIVLVDIGLPDGSGLDLIGQLSSADPRVGAIFGMSGDDGLEDAAMAAGADGFMAKPIASVRAFQQQLLDALPARTLPDGVQLIERDRVQPDQIALSDDLVGIAKLLDAPKPETLVYIAGFLSGLTKGSSSEALEDAAMAAEALVGTSPDPRWTEALRAMLLSMAHEDGEPASLALKRS